MYKKIIFPIDINAKNSWDYCIPTVVNLAKSFDAKIYLMTVIPDYGIGLVQQYFPKGWVKEIVAKSEAELKSIITNHVPKDVEAEVIVTQGAVYQSIIDKANELGVDLIAIPAHRPELRDYLLGPNAAKVVRHANISVLVIRKND
jgi:nucleotide-binding universal stress UspA family protein